MRSALKIYSWNYFSILWKSVFTVSCSIPEFDNCATPQNLKLCFYVCAVDLQIIEDNFRKCVFYTDIFLVATLHLFWTCFTCVLFDVWMFFPSVDCVTNKYFPFFCFRSFGHFNTRAVVPFSYLHCLQIGHLALWCLCSFSVCVFCGWHEAKEAARV